MGRQSIPVALLLTALVQAYLADGGDIDLQDGGGFTALHASIMHRHPPLTRYLIDQGADVNVAAKYGVAHILESEGADPR